MASHSRILAWRIPGTEEPGGLQSLRSQRDRHDGVTNTFNFTMKKLLFGENLCSGGGSSGQETNICLFLIYFLIGHLIY